MFNAAGKVFQTIDMVRWEEEAGKIILFLLFPLLYTDRSLHSIQILMNDSNLIISSRPLYFKIFYLDI